MTARLLLAAAENWTYLEGYAVGHGQNVPLHRLSLRQLCSYVEWMAIRNMSSPEEVDTFKSKLWRPPTGYTGPVTEGPWSPEAENSQFQALKAAFGR